MAESKRPKIGLALGSGGSRGLAYIGVIPYRCPRMGGWDQLGSNQRPSGYEPGALPLSYGPKIKLASLQQVYPIK